MAEPPSAALLWTIRNTTSRKPRNAATISDFEIAWLLSRRGSRQRLRRTTIAAPNRLSAIVAEVECRASPEGRPKPMSEAPILVLLAASGASLANASAAPGRDGDPIILGLSLTQRTALAAHRAGYAQVFLLGGDGRNAPGIAPVADWTSLAASLSSAPPASLILAPAAILAEGDWLERLSATRPRARG